MSKKDQGQSTSSVRLGHELDKQKLEKYLVENIPGFKAPLDISQFKLGQSNPTYLLRDGNKQQYVLRKKPPGALLSKTAHAVEREYEIINAIGKHTNVPVPKVYVLCEEKSIIGTPFYVMEFLKGRIFSDIKLLDLPFEERKQCWLSAVSTIAQLHSVDYKAIGLENYGKSSGFYTRQMKSLKKVSDIQAAVVDKDLNKTVGPIPRLDEMLAWFERNKVKDKATIIHGDYKIDNLVFHPTEPRVIGILDWELSTIGHPLSDLANLFQQFYVDKNHSYGGLKGLDPFPVPDIETLLNYYCAHSKEITYPIDRWMFAIAFSFFRLAVISQGIAARVARKQASSAEAKIYAEQFVPIANLGLAIVDKGELRSNSKL